MTHHNRFVIRNDFRSLLTLNIEPECVFFPLEPGQEVTVIESFASLPVTLKFSSSEDGALILTVWPGDGDVRVEQDGVDVFDLIQQTALVS